MTEHQLTVLRAELERLAEVQAGAPAGTWEQFDAGRRLGEISRLLADAGVVPWPGRR